MIEWLHPSKCIPPHRVTHPEKYAALCEEFTEHGWGRGGDYPHLVGYPLPQWNPRHLSGPINYEWLRDTPVVNGGALIQLVTGSHRWSAADAADILIPVRVVEYQDVIHVWGMPEWETLLQV